MPGELIHLQVPALFFFFFLCFCISYPDFCSLKLTDERPLEYINDLI